ncbi:MAG: phosphate signaling complex protein PhoU [Ghiorsea sp.]|nr:phosphate signaling complex protein PhoU [Ghiorsea sp.]MDQ7058726.1 phosphate signaling complex protein PhoU [Ghiorsea sp.]
MPHTLSRFDDELNELHQLINTMFKITRKNIKQSLTSIFTADSAMAEQVIARDEVVNALELKIDELARTLIIQFQPAASDLRVVFSATKIVTDLERMSDLATQLARNALNMDGFIPRKSTSIPVMRELLLEQVKNTRKAYIKNNVQLAKKVIEQDMLLDDSYENCQRVLLTRMAEDPSIISQSIALTNIAKVIERIGDHASNIAEMIIYSSSSHEVRHLSIEELNDVLEDEED